MTRNRAAELGVAGLPRNRAAELGRGWATTRNRTGWDWLETELQNWEGLGYN